MKKPMMKEMMGKMFGPSKKVAEELSKKPMKMKDKKK